MGECAGGAAFAYTHPDDIVLEGVLCWRGTLAALISGLLLPRRIRHMQHHVICKLAPAPCTCQVGCHFGVTTAALHKRAAYVVGVDKSEDNVAEVRRVESRLLVTPAW